MTHYTAVDNDLPVTGTPGTYLVTVYVDGFAPRRIVLEPGQTFQVLADKPFTFTSQFTDADGLVYRPTEPTTIAAVPQTPPVLLRRGPIFEGPDIPGPPAIGIECLADDPALPVAR